MPYTHTHTDVLTLHQQAIRIWVTIHGGFNRISGSLERFMIQASQPGLDSYIQHRDGGYRQQ